MLLILLKLKGMVEKYYKDYKSKLKEDLLSYTNWKKLCTIKDFLAPFLQATFITKGDFVSIDCTLFIIDILIKYL
jgi:hypothetical protein